MPAAHHRGGNTEFVNGRRIESVADAPVLTPGINAIGTTYGFSLSRRLRSLVFPAGARRFRWARDGSDEDPL